MQNFMTYFKNRFWKKEKLNKNLVFLFCFISPISYKNKSFRYSRPILSKNMSLQKNPIHALNYTFFHNYGVTKNDLGCSSYQTLINWIQILRYLHSHLVALSYYYIKFLFWLCMGQCVLPIDSKTTGSSDRNGLST